MGNFNPLSGLYMFFLIVSVAVSINGLETRKLDQSTVPVPGTTNDNCSPCTQSPPPPIPVLPPPSPPPPPPPSPKKPKSPYCPPPPGSPGQPGAQGPPSPPSPSFIYMTGPPGDLYPVDQGFGGAARDFAVGLPVLVGCGLLSLFIVL